MMFEMSNTENNFFFGKFFGGKKKSEIVALLVLLSFALKNLAHLYLENSIFEQKKSQDAKIGGKTDRISSGCICSLISNNSCNQTISGFNQLLFHSNPLLTI